MRYEGGNEVRRAGTVKLQRCRMPRRSSSSSSRSRVRSVRATSCQPRPVSAPSSAQSRLSEAPGQCARTRRQGLDGAEPAQRRDARDAGRGEPARRHRAEVGQRGDRLGSRRGRRLHALRRWRPGRGLRARGQRALALGGVGPPGLCRRALDEAHRRDEGVEHAGIVAHAGTAVEHLVERVGIAAGELRRPTDADRAQVGGDGRADVGQVFEMRGTVRHGSGGTGNGRGSHAGLLATACDAPLRAAGDVHRLRLPRIRPTPTPSMANGVVSGSTTIGA